MEPYITGFGQKILVHDRDRCTGGPCVIHNPSNHPMRDLPTYWRSDRGIMERICPHGIGHPDPDGIEFIRQTRGDKTAYYESIHGCDACCKGVHYPEKPAS